MGNQKTQLGIKIDRILNGQDWRVVQRGVDNRNNENVLVDLTILQEQRILRLKSVEWIDREICGLLK